MAPWKEEAMAMKVPKGTEVEVQTWGMIVRYERVMGANCPVIKLANGSLMRGYECWWITKERAARARRAAAKDRQAKEGGKQ